MLLKNKTDDILTIDNLSFSYDEDPFFSGLFLSVKPGDMIGVIGPNGSGKSTLLHLMNGFVKPCSGRIILEGKDLSQMDPRTIARSIAYVPQQTVVAHNFSVFEIVLMGRFPYKSFVAFENAEDLRVASRMLDLTGVSRFKNRRFHSLSGGEQQRVVVAAALAQEPSLMLLDEPTSALDIHYQLHIFNILRELNRTVGLTVVCAVHDINLASLYCDRIWLIDKDHSILDGHPNTILQPDRIGRIFDVHLQSVSTPNGRTWLLPDPSVETEIQ